MTVEARWRRFTARIDDPNRRATNLADGFKSMPASPCRPAATSGSSSGSIAVHLLVVGPTTVPGTHQWTLDRQIRVAWMLVLVRRWRRTTALRNH
jgi:hypothetical protein